jgi:hypothetical protein
MKEQKLVSDWEGLENYDTLTDILINIIWAN